MDTKQLEQTIANMEIKIRKMRIELNDIQIDKMIAELKEMVTNRINKLNNK